MYEYFDEVQSWLIVFDKGQSEQKRWWHLLPLRMGHVFLLREAGSGVLMLNPVEWGLAVRYESISLIDAAQHYGANAQAILSYTCDYRRNVLPVRRGVITCVSIVKAVLGLRKCRAVTPFGLYRQLLKRGAFVVKPFVPYVGEKNYG